jgi:ornithine decarboxylase
LRTDFNGFYPDRFVEVEDDAFLPSDEMEPCQRLNQAAE